MAARRVVCIAVLEAVLAQCVVLAASVGGSSASALNTHMKLTRAFACGPPQPRAFKYEDIVDDPEYNSEVQPPMTVLHRCDSQSGCCEHKSKVCKPLKIEEVQLTFLISRVVPGASSLSTVYYHQLAENHTQCACESEYDRPK